MQTNDFSNLPTSWQIKTLGEIYDITSSKRVFKDEWKTDGIPFYRARDLVSFSKNEPIKIHCLLAKLCIMSILANMEFRLKMIF